MPLLLPKDSDTLYADLLNQNEESDSQKEYRNTVDIIKEELIHTSTSEADRIAEKLKLMLAPLSGQQNRVVDPRTQARECHEEISVTAAVYSKNKDSVEMYQDSDLLEILDQDLLFSTENDQQNNQYQPPLKDELPSKSS